MSIRLKVNGLPVYKTKLEILNLAVDDPTLINTKIGYLRTEGLDEELWLRNCLRCDKLFVANGQYIRSCRTCKISTGTRRIDTINRRKKK